jgi:hypothetical protein
MSVYIQCKVLPGLFDREVYVMVDGSSAYVNRADVKVGTLSAGQEVDGLVRAYVLQEKDDKVLIELSGEPVVGGLRNWVSRAKFASA